MSTLKDAALNYAINGWEVFPLQPGQKIPAIKRGFKAATSNVEKIAYWWSQKPNANIGLRPSRNVIVLDVDPRNNGSLDVLQAHLGTLPLSAMVVTGRHDGGLHLYYVANPEQIDKLRSQATPGVDVKTHARGYLVAPPSVHPDTGLAYEWINAPFRQLPHQAIRALSKPTYKPINDSLQANKAIDEALAASSTKNTAESQIRGYKTMCERMEKVSVGQRNDYLNKCAYVMGKENAPAQWLDALKSAAIASGLNEKEVNATLASAAKGGK